MSHRKGIILRIMQQLKQNLALWRSDTWVKPYFGRYKKQLFLSLFLGFATFVFASALMFTSGYLVSGSAVVETILLLHMPLLFVRIFGLGKPPLQYLERLCSHNWVLHMTSALRRKLFDSVQKDAIFFRSLHRMGDVLGLLAEDVGHIQNLYLRSVFPTFIAWVLYVVLVVCLVVFLPSVALVVALLLALVVFVLPLASLVAQSLIQKRRKYLRAHLYAELSDNVLGVADWLIAGRSEDYCARHRSLQHSSRVLDERLARFARKRDMVVQVIFGLVVVVLVLGSGARFGGKGGDTANWIAAFVLGFFPLIEAFAPLSDCAVETLNYRDSVVRLNRLSEAPACSGVCANSPQKPLDICFENVGFSYAEAVRPAVSELTLTIASGQSVALLGRSGAGKSTLTALLRGDLRPQIGEVRLGGVPTSSLGESVSRYMGVIQQNTYLFNRSLLDNLRIGKPDASENEVESIMCQVGLKSLLERLPEGLHAVIDEAGLCFSGGERHRIALARVLLQRVPIIVLDEPMVGLDPLTENALLETLFQVSNDKTLIMITHHLQGVSQFERVLFMDEGRLSMDGSPAHLQATSARYRRLLAFDQGKG